MTREEAIKRLEWLEMVAEYVDSVTIGSKCTEDWDAYNMAIAALREQEQKRYTAHEVACIIAELFGDACACNFNNIDEWLPEKCELLDACPNTVGVACWEQYLKFKEDA